MTKFSKAGSLAVLLAVGLLLATPDSAVADTVTPPSAASQSAQTTMSGNVAAVGPVAAAQNAAVNPVASAISLPPGLAGFDNVGADSATTLSCLSNAGYSFDVIDALGAGWDTEYRSAAAIGMSVLLFQGFYQPFWSDPAKGTARGQLMVSNAQSVGYPRGAEVFLNLENDLSDGTNPVTKAGIVQWVQNWAATVRAAGYTAGIYVGVPQILSPVDLDSALSSVDVFWRSASGSAPQTAHGYVMRQPSISVSSCGSTIDNDTSSSDSGGATLVGAGFARSPTAPGAAGALQPLTPQRILDTRGSGAVPGLGARSVQILGAGGVPTTGVGAVVINLTVVNTGSFGFLTAWPTGQPQPDASNLNFTAGQTVPNLVVVPVGADGTIQVYNGSGAPADIIVDVDGYYRNGTPTAAGTLGPLTPSRILDTRGSGAVPALGARSVQILGAGGVPTTGVGAVVINLTVVNTGSFGFLTAWPTGQPQPHASNLNFTAGQTVPNLVVVPVGADGTIQVYNGSEAPADIIVDVDGYYRNGTPTAAGTLGPLTPSRILDTRASGALGGGSALMQSATGKGGVPPMGISAVVINLTVVNPNSFGFLTAWPSGQNRPNASNLNFTAGQTVANLVIVPVGVDGKFAVFNGSPTAADVIIDVVGYIVG